MNKSLHIDGSPVEGFDWYEGETSEWSEVFILGRSLEGRLCRVSRHYLPTSFMKNRRGRLITGGRTFEFKQTPNP